MDETATKRCYTALRDWSREFDDGIPILMYHKVMSAPWGTKKYRFLYISPSMFSRQIAELREASFRAIHLQDALANDLEISRKIVLTFDDAFRSVFQNALPRMTQAGFRGITYVVADRIGDCNDWDRHLGDPLQPLMSHSELREWISAGNQVGSHTNTHPNLTRVTLAEAREEIFGSKKKLEDAFGSPVSHFCYPYGAYNPEIRDLAQEAGYTSACSTVTGINRSPINQFDLKRLTARYASRSLKTYWNKIREAVLSMG